MEISKEGMADPHFPLRRHPPVILLAEIHELATVRCTLLKMLHANLTINAPKRPSVYMTVYSLVCPRCQL